MLKGLLPWQEILYPHPRMGTKKGESGTSRRYYRRASRSHGCARTQLYANVAKKEMALCAMIVLCESDLAAAKKH